MYITKGSEEVTDRIITMIKKQSTSETTRVTIKEAFFTNKYYTRSSWVAVFTIIFGMLDGFRAYETYQNTIFSFFLNEDTFINAR